MDTPTPQRNFILQQGLPEPAAAACPAQYSALLFQPRIVALAVLAGTIASAWSVFAVLAAVLLASAAFPRLNPFDAAYNALFAARSGQRLGPAPAPRRFAQLLAGSIATGIVALIRSGNVVGARILEGVFLLAVALLVFGAFCAGSFVFHLLRGRFDFVRRTLPWVRG